MAEAFSQHRLARYDVVGTDGWNPGVQVRSVAEVSCLAARHYEMADKNGDGDIKKTVNCKVEVLVLDGGMGSGDRRRNGALGLVVCMSVVRASSETP